MPPGIVRVAVVQAAPAAFDTPTTLERLRDLVAQAAGRGARLVVVPEAFVGGYPKGSHFGTVLGGRLPGAREWFARYHAAAVDLPGPDLDALRATARDHGVILVAGVVERDGATLYCTAVFIGADGEYLGKHRKTVPTAAERMVWGQGDGSTLTVVDTPAGFILEVRYAYFALPADERLPGCESRTGFPAGRLLPGAVWGTHCCSQRAPCKSETN